MKRTTLISVSVFASIMASGCSAAYDDDFEQEGTGSSQQAASASVGDWVVVLCRGGDAGIKRQISDLTAATAIMNICYNSGSSAKVPVIISNMKRTYYYSSNNATYWTNRRVWYAALKPVIANNTLWHNNGMSCFVPFVHRYFISGYNTNSDCKAEGMHWYYDYSSTRRTSECTWIRGQTAFKNAAANSGATITSNCSNVVGFDPLQSAAICDLQGWVC